MLLINEAAQLAQFGRWEADHRARKIADQKRKLKEIARLQSHEIRPHLARLMGLVSLIKDGMIHEGELPALLAGIQSSAGELDGVVRKIVRKTEEE